MSVSSISFLLEYLGTNEWPAEEIQILKEEGQSLWFGKCFTGLKASSNQVPLNLGEGIGKICHTVYAYQHLFQNNPTFSNHAIALVKKCKRICQSLHSSSVKV